MHTGTVEGFFSLLKRGVNGTFHLVSRKQLHRYLSEFEFRYNLRDVEDSVRAIFAIREVKARDLCILTHSRTEKKWQRILQKLLLT